MRRGSSAQILLAAMITVLLSITAAGVRAADPVVRAVLFYSPSCGHCHKVITEDLPPLFEKYGDRLQIIGINIADASGNALFNAAGDQCCLMVVCMESWFLADKDALSKFFGQGFKKDALPRNENIEAVSKEDVYVGLRNASAHCKTKAPYGKGEHSFRILKLVAPEKVREASPWARRFFETLSKYMER